MNKNIYWALCVLKRVVRELMMPGEHLTFKNFLSRGYFSWILKEIKKSLVPLILEKIQGTGINVQE